MPLGDLQQALAGLRGFPRAHPAAAAITGIGVAAVGATVGVLRLGSSLQQLDDEAIGASTSVRQLQQNQRALLATTGSLSDAQDKAGSILESYDRVARSVRSPEFGIEGLRDFQLGIGRLGISLQDFLATRGDVVQLVGLFDGITLDVATEEGRRNLDLVRESLGDITAVEIQQQVQFRRDYPERAKLIDTLSGGIGRLSKAQQADLKVAQGAISAISGSVRGGLNQVLAQLAPLLVTGAQEIGNIVERVVTWEQETGGITKTLLVLKAGLNGVFNISKAVGAEFVRLGAVSVQAGADLTAGLAGAFGFVVDAAVLAVKSFTFVTGGIADLIRAANRLPGVNIGTAGLDTLGQGVSADLERFREQVSGFQTRAEGIGARAGATAASAEAFRNAAVEEYRNDLRRDFQAVGDVTPTGVPSQMTQTNNFEINGVTDPEEVADAVERRQNDTLRAAFGLP